MIMSLESNVYTVFYRFSAGAGNHSLSPAHLIGQEVRDRSD